MPLHTRVPATGLALQHHSTAYLSSEGIVAELSVSQYSFPIPVHITAAQCAAGAPGSPMLPSAASTKRPLTGHAARDYMCTRGLRAQHFQERKIWNAAASGGVRIVGCQSLHSCTSRQTHKQGLCADRTSINFWRAIVLLVVLGSLAHTRPGGTVRRHDTSAVHPCRHRHLGGAAPLNQSFIMNHHLGRALQKWS